MTDAEFAGMAMELSMENGFAGFTIKKLSDVLRAVYNQGVEDTQLNGGYNLKDIWNARNEALEDAAVVALNFNPNSIIAETIRALKRPLERCVHDVDGHDCFKCYPEVK